MVEYVFMPKADYQDACDAVREKTGGTEVIKSGELGEMIRGIESGGGDNDAPDTIVFDGLYVVDISPALSAENIIVKADYMNASSSLPSFAASVSGKANVNHQYRDLSLVAEVITPTGAISFRNGFNGLSLLETITLTNIQPKGFYQAFQCVYGADATSLKSIYGLDFTRCGGANYAIGSLTANQFKLENVTLVPNTCGKLALSDYSGNTLDFSSCSLLTDDSLISIANGLCADNTSTLTLHATPKTRCDEILGTVSSVTDDTGTYDFFTQDEAGDTTLTEFITTVKGWTLA